MIFKIDIEPGAFGLEQNIKNYFLKEFFYILSDFLQSLVIRVKNRKVARLKGGNFSWKS